MDKKTCEEIKEEIKKMVSEDIITGYKKDGGIRGRILNYLKTIECKDFIEKKNESKKNKTKKGLSEYNLFMSECSKKIKKERGDTKQKDIFRECAMKWKEKKV